MSPTSEDHEFRPGGSGRNPNHLEDKPLKKAVVAALVAVSVWMWAMPARAAGAQVVNVFNWSEYIPQSVLDQFTKETGIEVVYTTYESNEAMFAKLKLLGGAGYDVVVPSVYLVGLLAENKLLAPIDKKKLGDLSMLDKAVMGQAFDPDNSLSIPYMWGGTGLVVNKKYVDPATITSWNDLLRPEFKGRVILSDDVRDSMGVALKAQGYSLNTTKESEIRAAYEWLKKLKPSVRVFDVTATKQAFISEEVIAGICWNGDAYIAMQENPNLVFIYPKEGAILWMDSFVISAASKNVDNAHAFIRFMLRPEVAKQCVEEYNYTTPNVPARKLLDENMLKSRVMHPTEADLKNAEFTLAVGEALPLYDKYWEMLKTGN